MSAVGLYLEDGTAWPGVSVGAPGAAVGEAVFTTAMTGYQEALTDPSFARQLLTFTAPMIGNYGVEDASSESRRVQATALICHEARNYRPTAARGCSTGCAARASSALSGLDTRALVRHLRDRGAMLGRRRGEGVSREQALELLAAEPPMAGRLLAGEVSGELDGVPRRRPRAATSWCWTTAPRPRSCACWSRPARSSRSCRTTRRRRRSTHSRPTACCSRTGPATRLDGRACRRGARDGRSGASALRHLPRPPVARPRARARDVQAAVRASRREPPGARGASGRVLVTSQNHGFAVRAPENGDGAARGHARSLYDGTVEGLRLRGRPVWSMQFHPEASPGPHDAREKLAEFVEACAVRARGAADAAARRSPARSRSSAPARS